MRGLLNSFLATIGRNTPINKLAIGGPCIFPGSKAVATANCLVTDIRMPNVDGLELQRRLKRERPELPIIFMTAHHDDGEIERHVVEDGAVGFLHKSFTGSEFLRAIRHALGAPSART